MHIKIILHFSSLYIFVHTMPWRILHRISVSILKDMEADKDEAVTWPDMIPVPGSRALEDAERMCQDKGTLRRSRTSQTWIKMTKQIFGLEDYTRCQDV